MLHVPAPLAEGGSEEGSMTAERLGLCCFAAWWLLCAWESRGTIRRWLKEK